VTSAALGHPRGVKKWAAEHAVGKMSEPLWKLQTAIENLEEKDLAVLAELLVEKAELDGYMAPVWNGMREISPRSQEVQRLRRTGEGAWWAPVDMMKWTGPNISESAHHWEEKRDTREAAAATAREIAQANSHLIESDMTVEIRVCTDLEYQHGLD
jgi:hypothetical protein